MPRNPVKKRTAPVALPRTPSGIAGLDEITGGGFPRGRPTLVCGSAGCGKTLFAMEFLVRGALEQGEPGVFISFEETADELTSNVRSLGFDLVDLEARGKVVVDHVHIDRSEIEEAGDFGLDGLFIRMAHAIASIGARRVVLDTIEALFSGFSNQAILRAELRRLFRWLKDQKVTAVITAERGDGQLTRQGLEEYVSDCVILLDHRVIEQISTRRLRVVKYRGGSHGTNEYPFIIDEDGISVLPITSLGLQHATSDERVSTGIPGLDTMLGGKGFYRGTSVLVSGTAGTGKTSLVCQIADAVCRRRERCLYFAYEESPDQIIRNMRSIGIDLARWVKQGLLEIHAARPSTLGLEMHLASTHKRIERFKPHAVIIDPISNLTAAGSQVEASAMLLRLIDYLKSKTTTGIFTSLVSGDSPMGDATEEGISSLIDSWLLVKQLEQNGERNRVMYVLKSRGMNHSNQVREFLLTSEGIALRDVYLGSSGVLTGSARLVQEARDREVELLRQGELNRQRGALDSKRKAIEAQIAALGAELSNISGDLARAGVDVKERALRFGNDAEAMSQSRGATVQKTIRGNGAQNGR